MFPEQTLLLYQQFGAKIVSSHRRRRAMQTATFHHVNEQKTFRHANKQLFSVALSLYLQ